MPETTQKVRAEARAEIRKGTNMDTYRMRYGKTYNLGNFESERIDLEREFSNAVPVLEALKGLMDEIETARQQLSEPIPRKAI